MCGRSDDPTTYTSPFKDEYEEEDYWDTVVDLAPVEPPKPLVEPDWFLEMEYEDRFRSDLDE